MIGFLYICMYNFTTIIFIYFIFLLFAGMSQIRHFILHFNIITTPFLDKNIAVKVDFSAIAFNNMQYAPHLKVKYRGTLTSFKKNLHIIMYNLFLSPFPLSNLV